MDKNNIKEIFQAYHGSKSNRRVIKETLKRIQEEYNWINSKNYIRTAIKACGISQHSKYKKYIVNM